MVIIKDVFDIIDGWNNRLNIIRQHEYVGKVALVFAVCMVPVWIILGYDSGVGMIEEAIKNLPQLLNAQITVQEWINIGYSVYGRSFHFSSYIIYGLLFFGCTKLLHRLNIRQSRNVVYSGCLTVLNIAVFEWFYMGTFAIFQSGRNLIEWFITDLWFLQQYLLVLILGIIGLTLFIVESHQTNPRSFKFHPNTTMFIPLVLTVAMFLTWINYPFISKQVSIGTWTSSHLFPQTHYAYINAELYVKNNVLHTVNLLVKTLFAVTQFTFLTRFKRWKQ